MFVDSHAHLSSPEVLPDLEAVLDRALQQKISKIVNICTDQESLEQGLSITVKKKWIFNAAATTPHDVEKEGEIFFPLVEALAKEKKLIAIGETGLDYYYEHSNRLLQKKYLIRYCQLACREDLPLIIHCRDAFSDLFEITKSEYSKGPLLLHCFTGTKEEAKEALNRGWLISFSGIITFKKSEALRNVVDYVPLESILVETDTPYLAPQSHRGKQNEPSFLPETVETLAKIKKISAEHAGQATAENAIKFFSF